MRDSVKLNQIYFFNQPSLMAMFDEDEEDDEAFMKRSWLAVPVEVLQNELVRSKEFSFESQEFSFQECPIEIFNSASSISDSSENSDGFWAELKRWAAHNNCKVKMSRKMFDNIIE